MAQEHCAGYDNSIQYQGNEYLCRPSCYFNIVSVLNSSSLRLPIHCQYFFGLVLSFFMLVFGVVLVDLLVCRAFIGLRSVADCCMLIPPRQSLWCWLFVAIFGMDHLLLFWR